MSGPSPGSSWVKSTLAADTVLSFAGVGGAGALVGRRAEGDSCLPVHAAARRRLRATGARTERRRGAIHAPRASARGSRGRLHSLGTFGPRSHVAVDLPAPGATGGGGRALASHARAPQSMVTRVRLVRRLAPACGGRGWWGRRFAACSGLTARAVARRVRRKAAAGSEGQRDGAGGNTLPPPRAKIDSLASSCSRVVHHRVCRSRRTVQVAEKRSPRVHPNVGRSWTGTSARGLHARKRARRGRRSTARRIEAEAHVTALEIAETRAWRGGSSMEVVSDRQARVSSRSARPKRSRPRSWCLLASNREGPRSRRQGRQRYGRTGSARKTTPRAKPQGPPKRIGRQ
jgi:hypothetical protein